jgi:hypothetical protein
MRLLVLRANSTLFLFFSISVARSFKASNANSMGSRFLQTTYCLFAATLVGCSFLGVSAQAQTSGSRPSAVVASAPNSDKLAAQALQLLQGKSHAEAVEVLTQAIANYRDGSNMKLATLYGLRGAAYLVLATDGGSRVEQVDPAILNLAKADLDKTTGVETNGIAFAKTQAIVNQLLGSNTSLKPIAPKPESQQSSVKPNTPQSTKPVPPQSTPVAQASTATKQSGLKGLRIGVTPEQLFTHFQAVLAPEPSVWDANQSLIYSIRLQDECITQKNSSAQLILQDNLDRARKNPKRQTISAPWASSPFSSNDPRVNYEMKLRSAPMECIRESQLLSYQIDYKSKLVNRITLSYRYVAAPFGYNLGAADISMEQFVAGLGKRLGVPFKTRVDDKSRIETRQRCVTQNFITNCGEPISDLVLDKATYYEASYPPCKCNIIVRGGSITLVDAGNPDAVKY